MAALDDLKEELAGLLEEPEKSMNSRLMLLTKARLLSRAGRGRKAAAQPSDATNIVLGVLGGGLATQVAATVMALRYMEWAGTQQIYPDVQTLNRKSPFPVFDRVVRGRWPAGTQGHLLGDFLDALFEWKEDGALTCHDSGLSVRMVEISITRAPLHGIVGATIKFVEEDNAEEDTGGREWESQYWASGWTSKMASAVASMPEFEKRILADRDDPSSIFRRDEDTRIGRRGPRASTQSLLLTTDELNLIADAVDQEGDE